MLGDVALGALVFGYRLRLHVDRHGDVRHATIGERGASRELNDVLGVLRAHDAGIVDADIHVQFVELDVLLRVGMQEVVELEPGDGEHRLPVELGVVEAVEQMDAARTGRCQTDTELSRPLGIGAGVERRSLLVTDLNEANLVLARAQRLDNAVNAVPWDAEDRIDVPADQGLDKYVCCGGVSHRGIPCIFVRHGWPLAGSTAADGTLGQHFARTSVPKYRCTDATKRPHVR